MNKLMSLLILIIVLSCSSNKKDDKIIPPHTIQKTEFLNDEIESKVELINSEKEIVEVALSFHLWYIENTNDIKSEIPTDFIVKEGESDNCIVDYEPYFNELRKLGTISNLFLEEEKNRTKFCAEGISKMNWSEYIEVIPENCDDYLYWTKSQEETSGIELISVEEVNAVWEVKFHLFNSFNDKKSYTPYTGIIIVEKEEKGFMITKILWDGK